MIILLVLALSILGLLVWRAMDKASTTDVTGIVRGGLTAIVTLVLTYAALRVLPPESAADLLHSAFTALRTA
ncbi:hypothetical protein STRCI_008171 [Streptomyces cinnabarinus]|uniref:DUF2304 domain-containing protein n=1 Tax=Streptomyces cinnabarinus TaxID=67287 RepID=A0ABY7KT59_9ACTN|nr:hypothetical protein [Streptomyces cinnabarinus]WAZ26577.1 hypothetical protein STRCI_008171 [Streptomyces cinnabarinus]